MEENLIRIAKTAKDWEDFYSVTGSGPGDPPARPFTSKVLNVDQNPVFRQAFMRPILIGPPNKPGARAVGFFDENRIRYRREPVVTFGHFAFSETKAVPQLLKALESWTRGWGAKILRGPLPLYPFGAPGVDQSCDAEFKAAGFFKKSDFLEYELEIPTRFDPALEARVFTARENPAVQIREWNQKDLSFLPRVLEIINDSYSEHPSFDPVGPDEADFLIREVGPLLKPEFSLIAEVQGEPAGFLLAIPRVSRVEASRARNWSVLDRASLLGSGTREMRVVAFAVRKKFRFLGIAPLLAYEIVKRMTAGRTRRCFLSGIESTQKDLIQIVEGCGGKKTGSRTVYEKVLT